MRTQLSSPATAVAGVLRDGAVGDAVSAFLASQRCSQVNTSRAYRTVLGRLTAEVLDVAAVTEMDHTAATMLDAAAQVAAERRGFVRLAAPSAPVCAAIGAFGAARVTMHASTADAVANRNIMHHADGA